MAKIQAFLKRKGIVISAKHYAVEVFGAMAQGLFASLLIGTILGTLGTQFDIEVFVRVSEFAKDTHVVGAAMACSIGWALHCPPLVLCSLVAVGAAANELGGAGGPLAVVLIAVVAGELGKAVSKETKVDILVTPFVTVFSGCMLASWFAPGVGAAALAVGRVIMWATELQPFFLGILVSLLVGMALTLPISSAALCAALGLTGLAGGAALAGCCAQMVGFAVLSFRENGWGGLVSQGLGTSKLQMGNVIKNPRIWIPTLLTSAILGPVATVVFQLKMNGAPVAAGMGTCGLVGPLGVYTGWIAPSELAVANGAVAMMPTIVDWIELLLIAIILPAVLTLFFGEILRKLGWIRENDLKLNT